MFAKKTNARRIAMAAVEAAHKRSRLPKAGKAPAGSSAVASKGDWPHESALDDLSGGDPSTALLRSIGENLDTRLQEIAPDEDLDADLFEEKRHQLMEEARLAAGTQQRVVSKTIAAYLSKIPPGLKENENDKEGAQLRMLRVHHNCNAITAVAMLGEELIVLGDKSGKVYIADLTTNGEGEGRGRTDRAGGKFLLEPTLASAVVSVAVSDTRANRPTARDLYEKTTVDRSCTSYTAAGAADGSISIWETSTRRHKGLLLMHRRAVTGLSFRLSSAALYSGSEDGTLRVWNVEGMSCADVLFGHEGAVHGLHGLRRETCATVGGDRTMRFWRIDAATQQSYQYLRPPPGEPAGGPSGSRAELAVGMETTTMLNERLIVVGATDGSLVVFDVNRRRPLAVVEAAHGYDSLADGTGIENTAFGFLEETKKTETDARSPHRRIPNPISAVAVVPYADIVASASYDGVVRLWSFLSAMDSSSSPATDGVHSATQGNPGKTSQVTQLVCIGEIPIRALVTSMQFSMDGDLLSIACSKECRRGRWYVQKSALNSVCVVPLTEKGAISVLRGMPHAIEHVPALLYHYDEDKGANEAESEGKNSDDDDELKKVLPKRRELISEMQENDEDEEKEEDASNWGNSNEEEDDFFTVGEDGQLVLNRPEEPDNSQEDLEAKGGKSLKKKAGSKLLAKKGKAVVTKKQKIKTKSTRNGPLLQHPAKKLKKLRRTK
ncbi:unnamed protein product [Phytomonas sp. Hart1]|nr:unnamed protein product [Phytomonas sp. Hart1]|eukprot:CCW67634.1 unnamed protein product [Phytomonas sp. isolate Hart1]